MREDLWQPNVSLASRDKLLIRHAYEGTIDRGARLATFATSKPLEAHTEIESRRTEQAIDDVLLFAVYARRLIERTSTKSLAQNVSIGLWDFAGSYDHINFVLRSETIPFWKLLGILIHHQSIEVIRRQFDAKLFAGADFVHVIPEMLVGTHVSWIQPKIIVRSDRSKIYVFDSLQFIGAFQEKILSSAVVFCEDNGLDLDESNT